MKTSPPWPFPITLAALGAFLACAHSRAPRTTSSCALAATDSVYLAGGPVYRPCAVDRAARLRTRNVRIDFQPTPPLPTASCYSVQLEFVVAATGVPELETARLVRANNAAYGDAVLASLGQWRYEPARKDGVPVRQIVRETRSVAYRVVAVGSAQVTRPPSC
jgi:hypothetical protein